MILVRHYCANFYRFLKDLGDFGDDYMGRAFLPISVCVNVFVLVCVCLCVRMCICVCVCLSLDTR